MAGYLRYLRGICLGGVLGVIVAPALAQTSDPTRPALNETSPSTANEPAPAVGLQTIIRRKAGKPANEVTPVRTLIPASEVEGTAAHAASQVDETQPTFAPSDPKTREAEPRYDADSVFAKLKPLKRGQQDED